MRIENEHRLVALVALRPRDDGARKNVVNERLKLAVLRKSPAIERTKVKLATKKVPAIAKYLLNFELSSL